MTKHGMAAGDGPEAIPGSHRSDGGGLHERAGEADAGGGHGALPLPQLPPCEGGAAQDSGGIIDQTT